MDISPIIKEIFLFIVVFSIVVSCSDSPEGTTTVEFGSLKVITTTSGEDLDIDGYSVVLEGEEADKISVNGEAIFSNLVTGDLDVELNEITSNCFILGSNRRTVTIFENDTAEVEYMVSCEQVILRGKIVYSKNVGFTSELQIMNRDGSNQTRLTFEAGDGSPEISPDGQLIVFSSSQRDANEDDNFEIFTIDANGEPLKRITRTPQTVSNSLPSWSPDMQQIVFTQSGDASFFEDIVITEADGSGSITNLTSGINANDSNPDWSPDGSKIVFASDRVQSRMSIFIMDTDGSNVTQLTSGDSFESQPAWSPNGSKIAFIRLVDSGSGSSPVSQIYVMDSDGTNVIQLTNSNNDNFFPSWSPGGSEIVFQRIVNNQSDIFRMNSDGSEIINLTNTPNESESHPDWSPVQ